jgi:hypothetical protein
MDSLKSLMDKKEYQLVLDLTKGSGDPEALFYRATAYISLNQPEPALALLTENRAELYQANPVLLMKVTFELRFIQKQFDEAYKDLEWFSNQPYVSQAVEEQLRAAPALIRSNERAATMVKDYSPEEVEKILLNSPDDYEVLSMLSFVQSHHLADYIALLRQIVVSNRHPYVRTYALLLLLALKDPNPISFPKNGQVYRIVPAELEPPYTGETYNDFVNALILMAKDPAVSETSHQILNDYIMDVYPEKVIAAKDDRLLMTALIKLGREYLKSSLGIEGYLAMYHLEANAVDARASQIKSVLDSTPVLKY